MTFALYSIIVERKRYNYTNQESRKCHVSTDLRLYRTGTDRGLHCQGPEKVCPIELDVPDIKIIACDINREALLLAKEAAVADVVTPAIDASFTQCDYLFLCAPVRGNDGNLEAVKAVMKPGCLLTDVGSVKTAIHEAVREAGLEESFIGGHPMAGSERVGFANSKASLLENAYYILTPTARVSREKVEAYRNLVAGMGAIPLILDCRKHDYVTAAISHLPHVIAASLVNLVRDSDSEDGVMRMVAAGGFKDITRIASSSPAMWQQICLTNGSNISSLLTDYIGVLTEFREQIDGRQAESLYEQFESARIYRDSFLGASSGPIKPVYGISVDIDDKTGALARIVTLLAERGISIKNIGITHNRESEDGVLKLEFYGEAALAEASGLLAAEGYAPRARS